MLLVLKKTGVTKFIVWCGAECCARVLDAAQRAGLLAGRHAYVAATLDLHTQPLANFSHGGANITSQSRCTHHTTTTLLYGARRVLYCFCINMCYKLERGIFLLIKYNEQICMKS